VENGRTAVTITLIFKIAAVGIIVALMNQILKHSGRDDQAYLVSLAGLIIVLSWLIPYVYQIFQQLNELFDF
jgi:stage III sporulation protein AC